MKEQLISFETAKLAKEKGFDQNPYKTKDAYGPRYTDGSDIRLRSSSLFSPETNTCVAPSQSILQKWLREEHKIHVFPLINIESKLFGYEIWDDKEERSIQYQSDCDKWDFKTYEQALEEGLKESLKLI